nr:cysteine desulfurase family protein [Allomuricauda sp.]
MKNLIYLDAHATTPVDEKVLSAMLPYFTDHYGNGNHKMGWKTNEALENSRAQLAQFLGARPSEITFTSGATEAINLGLLGLAQNTTGNRVHIITQRTEHKAVLECLKHLEGKGFEVTVLNVDKVGRIDLEELRQLITERTLMVAIMLANNEIGTVQPIEEIGELCRRKGAKFFCDITQGVGWYPLDMGKLKVDMAAMSAHKFYGPRGVGALYVRKSGPEKTIQPILFGGGQEKEIRPGTHNIPAIVGMGKACELLSDEGMETYEKVRLLRDRLKTNLFNSIPKITLLGCPTNRHPGNLSLAIPSITGEQLKELMPTILFSTSSACASASTGTSHVISALEVTKDIQKSVFRIGISKNNTKEEIDYVANKMVKVVGKLLPLNR